MRQISLIDYFCKSLNLYRKFQTEAMKARYEGYLAKQTVNATVEATVARKAVLSGAFGLVKAGAKLGLKAETFAKSPKIPQNPPKSPKIP